MRKKLVIFGIALVVLIAAVWGGSAIYASLENSRAPEQLALSTPSAAPSSTTGSTATGTEAPAALAGDWKISAGSQAGYRVKEVLNGQDVTVVGRTSDVEGQVTIDGTSLSAAQVTVAMTSVATDNNSRDSQFLGILKTAEFPTSTFTLTQAVDIAAIKDGVAAVSAVGDLTVAGVTKSVTVSLQAQTTASGVEVQGSIPIVFSDFGIAAPNLGFVKVEDSGSIEMLLQLSR
ncbi:YceI family protein [Arthrobacter sp. HLT1-20]